VRILTLSRPPPSAGPPDTAARKRITAGFQLEHAAADRGLADPGYLRHRPHPAMTQQPRLLRQH
jgi:hypothetical protein